MNEGTLHRSRWVRTALWCSITLNLVMAILTASFWLDQRASRLGLDTRAEAFKSVLGASALSRAAIVMRVAEESPRPGLTPIEVPPRGEQFYIGGGELITNRDISSAKVLQGPYGAYEVEVSFTREGAARIKGLTEQNVGKRLLISVDGKPLLAPVIRDPIDQGHTRISGAFTKDEAKRIVLALSRR